MAMLQSTNIDSVENGFDPYRDNPFDDASTRRHFIMKVYALLCVCISVTVIHVSLVLYCTPFRNFLFQHQLVLMIVSTIAYVIASLILSCCMSMLRNRVVGLIVLVVIVESLSIICALTTMYYETHIILGAAFGTALLCYVVTMVAICIPIDLTSCFFVMAVLGIVFTVFILVTIVVSIFIYVPILQIVVAFISVIVFAIYLAFVTQLIIGGRSYQLDEKDYLSAAIMLFVYVIIIFLNMLTLLDYFCQ